jgi:lysophospholipase L1-like esterase
VIRRLALAAVCAAAPFAVAGCAPNGPALGSDVEVVAAEPVGETSTPLDEPSDESAATADAGRAPADPEWPEFPNPAWPPVTLAPGEPPVLPASVNIIGDSIALSAQPILTATLESLDVEILAYDAVESRRMVSGSSTLPSGASAIEDVLTDGAIPELWIVALGTNDVGAMANADAVRADIERVLDLVPDNAHLIWVDTWVRDYDDLAVSFNAVVRDVLADRPYATVLDWYGNAAGNDALIISDGVHLSEVGKVEYARMIGDGLRALFTRP